MPRKLIALAAAPFTRRGLAALLYAALALPLALVSFVLVLLGLLLGGALTITALGPWLIAGTVRGAL
ncbi:sensor histidine kinase, partial [Streptomyces sp. T-3]|nr:sensor histidine kinase [Streptomyces sp. T-3]